MRLFYGNFDFEHRLARERFTASELSAAVRRLNAEQAFSLVSLAEPGDFIWVQELPDPDYRRHLTEIGLGDIEFAQEPSQVHSTAQLSPWGWSAEAIAFGEENRWICECPEMTAVAEVNSREFSAKLEHEWNVGLPHARTIRNTDELCAVVESATNEYAAWVVKANFGMSARERVVGQRSPPGEPVLAWVRKRLAQNGLVFFEPWVQRICEVGFQFTIPKTGEPWLEGITPLFTDSRGTYRGSGLSFAAVPPLAERTSGEWPELGCASSNDSGINSALGVAFRASRRAQERGYFGSLGIDAMCFCDANCACRWRPLQDVNARLTMGRTALGLRRLLKPGEYASWLHVRRKDASAGLRQFLQALEARLSNCRLVRTSPLTVGSREASFAALLVVARSAEDLLAAERIVADSG